MLQIGGSDQWGNITAGCDLVRRLRGQAVYGMTIPLLTTSTGEKMGKSAGNALWLDPSLTSPFILYQYFVNLTDADALRLLPLLTLLPEDQVTEVCENHMVAPHERQAQKALAAEVCEWERSGGKVCVCVCERERK